MLTLVLWQRVVFLCVSHTLFRMSPVMVVRHMLCSVRLSVSRCTAYNIYMHVLVCVINYRMHGATIKIKKKKIVQVFDKCILPWWIQLIT